MMDVVRLNIVSSNIEADLAFYKNIGITFVYDARFDNYTYEPNGKRGYGMTLFPAKDGEGDQVIRLVDGFSDMFD